MSATLQKIQELKALEAKVEKMGGDAQIAKQHESGKLTARERINLLFDQGTFREIDKFVAIR